MRHSKHTGTLSYLLRLEEVEQRPALRKCLSLFYFVIITLTIIVGQWSARLCVFGKIYC